MISFQTILLRLGVAIVLGLLVGFEREFHEHAAGMRTLALVTLGSALFTVISAYGFMDLLGIAHVTLDPTRIASYIVAGIGFLGAGTIFLSRESERVKGLTTAASIWVMAAIGITCGAGLLLEASAATVLVLIVLIVFHFIEQLLIPRVGKQSGRQHILVEVEEVTGQLIASIYETCAASHIAIEKLHISTQQERNAIEFVCQPGSPASLGQALATLRGLAGVREIHARGRLNGE